MIFSVVFLYLLSDVTCDIDTDKYPLHPRVPYCQDTYFCQKRPNYTNPDTNCMCDSSCYVYGDCCQDVQKTPTFSENKEDIPNFHCEYRPVINDEYYIYIVKSCPEGTDEELKYNCENENSTHFQNKLPVSGVKSGFLYQNFHCAVCHSENYLFWKYGINCKWKLKYDGNYTVQSLLQNDNCQVLYSPPNDDVTTRKCFPVDNSCPTNEIDGNCQEGIYSPVFGKDRVFKNLFCAACNNYSEEQLTCSFLSSALYRAPDKRKIFNFSYRVLFDLNLQVRTSKKYDKTNLVEDTNNEIVSLCGDKQVFDSFSGTCNDMVCKCPFVYENGKCLLKEQIFNVTQLSMCSRVKLFQDKFTIINTSAIYVTDSKRTVYDFCLEANNTIAYVCVNETAFTTIDGVLLFGGFSDEERFLSLICSVISVTFLSICLLVYLCTPKLRNVPGKNLICLMASLLIAQLLFLLAPVFFELHVDNVCFCLSFLTHFAFLASFFWMNVMSFDIFYTFSKGLLNSRERGRSSKRFRFYSLYAWSGPLVIVTIAILVDTLGNSSFRPDYGERFCWISNGQGLLVFFLVPIMILLLLNAIFFISTAKNIYSSEKNTARVLKRKETCKLLIYIKLSVVMGLTWCFGYLATIADDDVTWYLFILFNTLQGFFIAVSFMCTKKVFGVVRERASNVYISTRSYTFSKSTSSTKSTNDSLTKSIISKSVESKC